MKPKTIAGALLPALTLWLLPGLSWAADFTFHVPVKVSNIPEEVQKVEVLCQVHAANNSPVGAKFVGVNRPASGNLDQEITVAFDANSGANASDAATYKCMLYLHNGSMRALVPQTNIEWAKVKAGTTYNREVTGNITQ